MSPVSVRLSVGRLGEAEVGDPDVAVNVEQEVGRLDVAVKDTLAVGVIQCDGGFDADAGDATVELAVGVGGRRQRGGSSRRCRIVPRQFFGGD